MRTLGEKIAYYRKQKGLSQEKVAEYMDISRQAVTKWESNKSRPSTENLILLSKLLEVRVEQLIEEKQQAENQKLIDEAVETNTNEAYECNKSNEGNLNQQTNSEMASMGKAPLLLCILSLICISVYWIYGSLTEQLSVGILVCSIIFAIPVQLFVHLYLANAIKSNCFDGIAGFDSKMEYNVEEVKHLLIRMDLMIGILSCTYIILMCACSFVVIEEINLSDMIIILYVMNFLISILYLR